MRRRGREVHCGCVEIGVYQETLEVSLRYEVFGGLGRTILERLQFGEKKGQDRIHIFRYSRVNKMARFDSILE